MAWGTHPWDSSGAAPAGGMQPGRGDGAPGTDERAGRAEGSGNHGTGSGGVAGG